jgi:hypothetical protein
VAIDWRRSDGKRVVAVVFLRWKKKNREGEMLVLTSCKRRKNRGKRAECGGGLGVSEIERSEEGI